TSARSGQAGLRIDRRVRRAVLRSPRSDGVLLVGRRTLRARQHHPGPPNTSFGEWGEILGDAVIATAILERLLHHSHVLNIRGERYRLKEKKQAGLFGLVQRAPEGAAQTNQLTDRLTGGSILNRPRWVKSTVLARFP